jgi:hypothetical protein
MQPDACMSRVHQERHITHPSMLLVAAMEKWPIGRREVPRPHDQLRICFQCHRGSHPVARGRSRAAAAAPKQRQPTFGTCRVVGGHDGAASPRKWGGMPMWGATGGRRRGAFDDAPDQARRVNLRTPRCVPSVSWSLRSTRCVAVGAGALSSAARTEHGIGRACVNPRLALRAQPGPRGATADAHG